MSNEEIVDGESRLPEVFRGYTFDSDPTIAAAERRWLEAITDNRGHAEINDRWEVVVRLQNLPPTRRVSR